VGIWDTYLMVRTDNASGIGGLTKPPAYFADVCSMSVTNLGSGKVGLTNFSCSNISWYAPSVGAGQPLISLVPGRITPATSCAFTMDVQDGIAGAAGGVTATFQFSLDAARRSMRGIAVPQGTLHVQTGSSPPAFAIDFEAVRTPIEPDREERSVPIPIGAGQPAFDGRECVDGARLGLAPQRCAPMPPAIGWPRASLTGFPREDGWHSFDRFARHADRSSSTRTGICNRATRHSVCGFAQRSPPRSVLPSGLREARS
jgi:hypothetical protein